MKKFLIIISCIIFALPVFADNFQAGVSAYNSKNYAYAETCFKNALKSDPYNDTLKYYYAITLVQNKKIADAKYVYKNIIQTSNNQEVVSLSQKGMQLLGDYSYHSVQNTSPTKVVLAANMSGNIIIINNIKLNDKLNTSFILDTGASLTLISTQVAQNLGISTTNAPKIKIMTGSGYIYAPKVVIKKIDVNGLKAYNVEAVVTDLPSHSSGSDQSQNVAGLLGLSFMKDFKVTVDRQKSQVTFEKN